MTLIILSKKSLSSPRDNNSLNFGMIYINHLFIIHFFCAPSFMKIIVTNSPLLSILPKFSDEEAIISDDLDW